MGKKIPTIKNLQTEYAILEKERRKLYAGYKAAREEVIDLKMARQTIDTFLGEPPQPVKKRTQEISLQRMAARENIFMILRTATAAGVAA